MQTRASIRLLLPEELVTAAATGTPTENLITMTPTKDQGKDKAAGPETAEVVVGAEGHTSTHKISLSVHSRQQVLIWTRQQLQGRHPACMDQGAGSTYQTRTSMHEMPERFPESDLSSSMATTMMIHKETGGLVIRVSSNSLTDATGTVSAAAEGAESQTVRQEWAEGSGDFRHTLIFANRHGHSMHKQIISCCSIR
jgi:hypothetical protein